MAFHDPFGRSDPDSVLVYINGDPSKGNYLYLFDQEPIQQYLHRPTFDKIKNYADIKKKAMVTSELGSEAVSWAKEFIGAEQFYYFFHGWAALDWYRGYDRTFTMVPPEQRTITKTFFSPNRIIGGRRRHRVVMLYHFMKLGLIDTNWISCPKVCPVEGWDLKNIAFKEKLTLRYSDILNILSDIEPHTFPGEETQEMSSYYLTNWNETAECLLYHVSETVAEGKRLHLTEKTFKPICQKMPFVLTATQGSLAYLREYGFKTFSSVWDESYDDEPDDFKRFEMVACLLKDLESQDRQALYEKCIPIIEYNYDWFYRGGFENYLWQELEGMLKDINDYFSS